MKIARFVAACFAALILAAVGVQSALAQTVVYTSNNGSTGFDAASTGAIAPGWSAGTGTWLVGTTSLVGSHTHTFGETTPNDLDTALLTGVSTVTDTDVTFAQKMSTADGKGLGAVVRADSGFTHGYLVILGGSGQFNVFKRVSGSFTALITSASWAATVGSGDVLKIRFQAIGSTVRVRFWNGSGAEPSSWDFTTTDTAVTAGGYSGLINTSGSATGVTDYVLTDNAAVSSLTIAPNNAAITYSPYNWNVSGTEAATINAGAYFRTAFTGTTFGLTFNTTNLAAPYPQLWCAIDNQAWTQATVAASVSFTIPSATLSNADVPYHTAECVVKSTTETQTRWSASSATAVRLTGIVLDSGASVTTFGSPNTFAPLLFYGTSITEGVRTLGESATNDTDRNDARSGWAYSLGRRFGEFGIVGFGASGLTVTGSGGVPVLSSSYALLNAGVTRTFSPTPGAIIIEEGTNDGSANTVSAMTTVLNGLEAAAPNVPIIVLRPFNGTAQASNLQAAIAACTNPSLVTYVDTTGMLSSTYGVDGLGLHPSGPNNLAKIAPALAPYVKAALTPTGTGSGKPTFRPGFH